MRFSAVDVCRLQSPEQSLPIILEQKAELGRIVAAALFSLPLAALSVSLASVAAAAVVTEPAPLALLVDKPAGVAGLLAAIGLTGALIVHPMRAALARIGRRQTIEITASRVTVVATSPIGSHSWSEPLSAYAGLAHHIRSSLSGIRHEIVLVHPDPARTVLVAAMPRLLQSDLDHLASMLSLPIVPASTIYARPAAAGLTLTESQLRPEPRHEALAA